MTVAYSGTERRLVLALDFGTTFSGVAYAILDPGQIPKIQSVTRFPGQENGDFKIPSVLVYNEDGSIRAAGAETRSCAASADAEDQDLVSVEWFKLHLCPRAMDPGAMTLPPIPIGKTAVVLIADFLEYLYRCSGDYIRDTHANGASLWQSVQGKIDIVLSHPNGWEGSQQTKMREAAVIAKLVPNDASGHKRLHFVTEGEASLHYCVNSGLASDVIKDGSSVMIVDCGGGTIDLTTYKFVSTSPIQVEETAAPGCILQGSTQVNARFRKFLQAKLSGTTYGTSGDIDAMMERFEKSTKPTFSDRNARAFIKFGGMRDKDPSVGIRNGAITIEGTDIEKAFKPSVDGIVDAIRTQRRTTTTPVDLVFLVGGFAASPWLHSQLQIILKADGVSLSRPDSHTNKAVSEGAVSFYLKKFVLARIARLTYGVSCNAHWKPSNPHHAKRIDKLFYLPSGSPMLPGAFQVYIAQGKRLEQDSQIRYQFYRESKTVADMNTFTVAIIAYRGSDPSPYWQDEEPESYSALCSIRADTSDVQKQQQRGPNGPYFRVNYEVVLTVGSTELKAQITWKENGVDKWSPAELIFPES